MRTARFLASIASTTFRTSTSSGRSFPEGWRELALNGAQIVFNPNATKPGLSNRLWEIEQAAAAAANGMFVAASNRVGREDNEYGDLAVTGDRAVAAVTLVQRDGRRVTYGFALSRQSGGTCDGCWLTDAVVERPEPRPDVIRI